MSAPAPPNTPYALLAFMPSAILVMIAAWIGDRCVMCSEGTAVAIRNDNLWDWACLPWFMQIHRFCQNIFMFRVGNPE